MANENVSKNGLRRSSTKTDLERRTIFTRSFILEPSNGRNLIQDGDLPMETQEREGY